MVSSRIERDLDRGPLLTTEVSVGEDRTFSSPTGSMFPVADSHGRFCKSGYLEGLTGHEDSYGDSVVARKLTLQE